MFSRRIIPLLKGTLAYSLVIALVFVRKFNDLTVWPANFQNALIPTIVAGTGHSIGSCLQGSLLVLLGVALGSVNFTVLANLARWPVVQGLIFALSVYCLAHLKAGDGRFFIVFLIGILMGFDGIMNSINNHNRFLPNFLLADAASNLIGLAIALAINIFVFPSTSERELRDMLVTSLGHIEELSNLIAKAYSMAATDDEMKKGDELLEIIRADFAFLTQILQNTSVEVNWSEYSMEDYRLIIQRIRGLQRAMFRGFNALRLIDLADKPIVARVVLPSSLNLVFRVRQDIQSVLKEVSSAIRVVSQANTPLQTGYDDFLSTEKQAAKLRHQNPPPNDDVEESRKGQVSASRDEEKQEPAFFNAAPAFDVEQVAEFDVYLPPLTDGQDPTEPITKLKRDFTVMQRVQSSILHSILIAAGPSVEIPLRMEEKLPSLLESYGLSHNVQDKEDEGYIKTSSRSLSRSGDRSSSVLRDRSRAEHAPKEGSKEKSKHNEVTKLKDHEINAVQESDLVQLNRALATVYSLLFSTESVVNELEGLYNIVQPPAKKSRRRLHIHLFPAKRNHPTRGRTSSIYAEEEEELSVKEALAILESKRFEQTSGSFWSRIEAVNQFMKTDQSIYSLKVAAISSVFSVLFYAPETRPWFNSFAMQAGLLASLVAFEQTLGQSIILFVTQVLGSGLGTVVALAVVEIFHDVGGYNFNPYGVCAFSVLYALPLQYVIYEKPRLFVFGLLALASYGSLVIHEAVLVNYAHIPFDAPSLATGKTFASLALAIGLVLIFQLFILRVPARRKLRIAMGELIYSTLAYVTIFQAYVQAVIPNGTTKRIPAAAVKRVERELIQRESQIFGEMMGISSLIVAAAAEPSSVPWRPQIPNRILQANGLLIDRFQEARIALGSGDIDPFILENMIQMLAPYRRQAHMTAKISLYLSATSLLSKTPLPYTTITIDKHLQDFIEDAVIISSRLASTEVGATAVKEDSFTRFWFYILCVGDMPRHLKEIEMVCKDMFGNLESDPKLK